MAYAESTNEEVTVIEHSSPKVIKTTKQIVPPVRTEHPQKVFEKKKTIFRFYQVIWYILTIIEFLLVFRFFLKAFGASPFSGFTSLIYALTDPLSIPFQGIFRASISGTYVLEWSTLIAMLVYALLAYGLVELFQFVKPVTPDEVEQTVDSQ